MTAAEAKQISKSASLADASDVKSALSQVAHAANDGKTCCDVRTLSADEAEYIRTLGYWVGHSYTHGAHISW